MHEFDCPSGFYVEGANETETSVVKKCKYDGQFETEAKKCELIPCTEADIREITPDEGDFVTTAEGTMQPADSIYFTCKDENKVRINRSTTLASKKGKDSTLNGCFK